MDNGETTSQNLPFDEFDTNNISVVSTAALLNLSADEVKLPEISGKLRYMFDDWKSGPDYFNLPFSEYVRNIISIAGIKDGVSPLDNAYIYLLSNKLFKEEYKSEAELKLQEENSQLKTKIDIVGNILNEKSDMLKNIL